MQRYLKDFKKELIIGPTFKLIEAIFELTVPLVMAKIIDVGVKNNDTDYIVKMGGVMVLLGVFGMLCALICQNLAAKASQGYGTVVRNELFQHISSLSAQEIDKIGTSSLITRMTTDINQLQVAVAMLIRLVVRAPFLIVGSAIIAFFIDFKLAFIFVLATPFIVATLYFIMHKSIPLYKNVQQNLDKITRKTRENLVGLRVIRAFATSDKEKQQFEHETDQLQKAAIRVGKLTALLNPINYVIMNVAIAGIVWFGGYEVFHGELDQGQIIALVQYMTQIMLALVVVANLVIIFTKAQTSAKRIEEVFALQPSINDNPADFYETEDEGYYAIDIKDLNYTYNGSNEYALKNITFKLYKDESLGIIGGTGSGKSTLVKLIARLYEAKEGNILLYGNTIKSYELEKLRKMVAIVPQKSVLFSGTIRDNLKFANKSATDEQLTHACEIAQAKEFVDKLPAQLGEKVLQGGQNFSGGQKQRLTIARAIAANPRILILDDSTSALDYQTDSNLRSAIASNLEDTVVVTVSQRAKSIAHCNLILVLDDGELVGSGTHTELIKECEIYREICQSQDLL